MNFLSMAFFSYKDSRSPSIRNSIKGIGYSKNQRALEYLVDLLEDDNPRVVSAVIWAIGKYKEKKILPKIVPKIKDDDDNVRAIAIKTLSKFTKNQEVLDEILKLLNDGDPKIRIMVMDAVLNFEASSIIENIIERLEKDEDKEDGPGHETGEARQLENEILFLDLKGFIALVEMKNDGPEDHHGWYKV